MKTIANSIHLHLAAAFCLLFLAAVPQAKAQCLIDVETTNFITPAPGSTLCADEPLILPDINFLAPSSFDNPDVMWVIYTGQPNNDTGIDPANTNVILADENGNPVFNGGTAIFANSGFFEPDDLFVTVTIVPIINPDTLLTFFDKTCTGIDLDFEYPTFTFLNPATNPDICGGDCVGNLPDNDVCAMPEALDLAEGVNGPFTNECATALGDPDVEAGCFFGNDPYASSVWFSFVGDGGTYSISTANCAGSAEPQLGDSQMAVYGGSCDALLLLECNDDPQPGVVLAAIGELPTVAGNEYFVLVDGFNNQQGEFCLEITQVEPPECLADAGVQSADVPEPFCQGESLSVSVSGDNADGFSTVIFYTDCSNTIMGTAQSGEAITVFAPCIALFAVNYDDAEEAQVLDLLEVGNGFPDFGELCVAIANVGSFVTLPADDPACIGCAPEAVTLTSTDPFAVCNADDVPAFGVDGGNLVGHVNYVLIADAAGNLVLLASPGEAIASGVLDVGDYFAYPINVVEGSEATINGLGTIDEYNNSIAVDGICGTEALDGTQFTILPDDDPVCFVCQATLGSVEAPDSTLVCQGGVGGEISIEVPGGGPAGYADAFLVATDSASPILGISESGAVDFAGYEPGSYCVYPFNYYAEHFAAIEDTIANGASIGDLEALVADGTVCADIADECVTFTVLSSSDPLCFECMAGFGDIAPPESDTLCLGESFVVQVDFTAPTDGYSSLMLVADESGSLQAFPPDTGTDLYTISLTQIGGYSVHIVNYLSSLDGEVQDIIASGSFDDVLALVAADSCLAADETGFPLWVQDCGDVCLASVGTVVAPSETTVCEQTTLAFSVTGAATDTFATLYILAQGDNIVETNASGEFAPPAGDFSVYVLNYANSDEAALLAAIADGLLSGLSDLVALEEVCAELSAATDISVLSTTDPASDCFECLAEAGQLTPTANDYLCAFSATEPISITGNNADGYLTWLLMANQSDSLVVQYADGNSIAYPDGGELPAEVLVLAINVPEGQQGQLEDLINAGLTLGELASVIADGMLCGDLSNAFALDILAADDLLCNVCEAQTPGISPDVAEVCLGGSLSFEISGGGDGYENLFLAVDDAGLILGIQTSGEFDFDTSGSFDILPVNVDGDSVSVLEDAVASGLTVDGLSDMIANETICAAVGVAAAVTVLPENALPCLDPLQVVDVQTTIAGDGLTYTVTFTIIGGTGSYLVDGDALPGDLFESQPIPCGDAYSFVATDDAASGSETVSGDAPCATVCLNDAGEMTAEGDEPLLACAGEFVIAGNTNAIIPDGFGLVYVLHDSATDGLGNVLATNGSAGSFSLDASGVIEPNEVYYISAVVGEVDANGGIVLDGECTKVAPGLQVVFLAPVEIEMDDDCDGQIGEYQVTFSISGGLPSYDPSSGYTVSGDYAGTLLAGEVISLGPFQSGTGVSVYAVDMLACSGGIAVDSIECVKTPIELLYFTGEAISEGNLLKWATATETDNDYFVLERSLDGAFFEEIAVVEGAGNSMETLAYDFLDINAPQGTSYYRLAQTDFNGGQTWSNVVALGRGAATFELLNVFPVPVRDGLNIRFSAAGNAQVGVRLYDITGKLLLAENVATQPGGNVWRHGMAGLASGVYLVTLTDGETSLSRRLVKE